MSNAYRVVQWNRHKRVYDLVVVGSIGLFIAVYVGVSAALHSGEEALSGPIVLMRALATCAIVLLHVVLCIGPMARLSPRFAPLLYNRRHLGVSMFLVALAHAALAVLFYGAFGGGNPVVHTVAGYWSWTVSGFAFETLGFGALVILFVMAATSHDFWLANLTPRVWKGLHMAVYGAYVLVVLHVALGAMQSERSLVYPVLMGLGMLLVGMLHIVAGRREVVKDRRGLEADAEWVDVGGVDEIADARAKVVCLKGRERVAVFRDGDRVSAVSNVCAHQGGPLGEGKIVGGCITCPWHGYQYLAHNGQSPPPYSEKIPTYRVRVEGRRILLHPEALPPGTPVEPARIEAPGGGDG